MTAQIIDGRHIAHTYHLESAVQARHFTQQHGRPPGLGIILVGDDPASHIYVGAKERALKQAGLISFTHRLPADIAQDALLAHIKRFNEDDRIDGILVQLPLPAHIDKGQVIDTILPEKDVDGFHSINMGRLATGRPGLVPCTPLGCLHLIQSVHDQLDGLDAIILGRSGIVGRPMAYLLTNHNCTVTLAHSRSRNLPDLVRRADIVIAAVGRPHFVQGDWVKPGATVIDVGINRGKMGEGQTRAPIIGDVDFTSAQSVAGAITPVPGGVGPMTIAMLLRNTIKAGCARLERKTR